MNNSDVTDISVHEIRELRMRAQALHGEMGRLVDATIAAEEQFIERATDN